jgi:hypothetical protein
MTEEMTQVKREIELLREIQELGYTVVVNKRNGDKNTNVYFGTGNTLYLVATTQTKTELLNTLYTVAQTARVMKDGF